MNKPEAAATSESGEKSMKDAVKGPDIWLSPRASPLPLLGLPFCTMRSGGWTNYHLEHITVLKLYQLSHMEMMAVKLRRCSRTLLENCLYCTSYQNSHILP